MLKKVGTLQEKYCPIDDAFNLLSGTYETGHQDVAKGWLAMVKDLAIIFSVFSGVNWAIWVWPRSIVCCSPFKIWEVFWWGWCSWADALGSLRRSYRVESFYSYIGMQELIRLSVSVYSCLVYLRTVLGSVDSFRIRPSLGHTLKAFRSCLPCSLLVFNNFSQISNDSVFVNLIDVLFLRRNRVGTPWCHCVRVYIREL